MDRNPDGEENIGLEVAASPSTPDLYSILVKVIDETSRDPAQLRKLVYATAWHNLKPDKGAGRSETLVEFERVLSLQGAIERVEADLETMAKNLHSLREPFVRITWQSVTEGPALFPEEWNAATPYLLQELYSILIKVIQETSSDPAELRKLVYVAAWHNLKPDAVLSAPLSAPWDQPKNLVELDRALSLQRAIALVEADVEMVPQRLHSSPGPYDTTQLVTASGALTADWHAAPRCLENGWAESAPPMKIGLPAELDPLDFAAMLGPEWLTSSGRDADRLTQWLDYRIGLALASVNDRPVQMSHRAQSSFGSFLQSALSGVIGAGLCIGIAGWFNFLQQPARDRAVMTASVPQALDTATIQSSAETVASSLELSRDETQLLQAHIKVPPSPPGTRSVIMAGALVPEATLLAMPSQISEKIPSLKGARFTTDRNGAIILLLKGSRRADAVISPN